MTLTLSAAEYDFICKQSDRQHNLTLDEFETIRSKPTSLGQMGYTRQINLMPEIELDILNWKCDRDLILKVPVHSHQIQLFVLTSGYLCHDEVYPTMGGKCGYLSGSGISPAHQIKYTRSQHFTGINIHIEPEIVSSFFPNLESHNKAFAKVLLKQNEWKESFFPEVTPLMRTLVRQVINAPYRGITRKLYLQAKVLELLAMQLDPIMAEFDCAAKSTLKPQSIDRIYQARDILKNRFENPPSIVELARQIGVSDKPTAWLR